jgi:hypothetical protein
MPSLISAHVTEEGRDSARRDCRCDVTLPAGREGLVIPLQYALLTGHDSSGGHDFDLVIERN